MTGSDRRDAITPPTYSGSHGSSTTNSRLPFSTLFGKFSDVAGEARSLFLDHGALLKSEMKQEAVTAGSAVGIAVVGGVFAVVGLLLVLMGSVYGLEALTHLPLWACFFINGAIFLVVGGLALALGLRRATQVNMVPERTLNSLKESVQCLVNLRK